MADTPASRRAYPTLERRLELIEDVPHSTPELIELVLKRRSIAEGYVAGELCVALYLRLCSRDSAFDSGEFLILYQRSLTGRSDDAADLVVPDVVDLKGEVSKRYEGRMDDAVFVDVGERLKFGEGVPLGSTATPSLVRLTPAQGGEVRRVDHLNDGEALEVVGGQGDGEGNLLRFLFSECPPFPKDDELPSEVVEGGMEVVDHVPDPATPIEDRKFFARFDAKDVIGAFRVGLSGDAKSAALLEGSDFIVKCLGMTLGLTNLGVGAIERLHRAGS